MCSWWAPVAERAEFKVTNPAAPRVVAEPGVRDLARQLAAQAADRTPHLTGRMAASWEVVPGHEPGTSVVQNTAPYARYVEYGTSHMAAEAPLGRSIAAGPR